MPGTHTRVVVVGASLAGVHTVRALRAREYAGEIVLVGAEPGAADGVAVDRPALSKEFLTDTEPSAVPVLSPGDLADLDARLVRGRAVDLDLRTRHVVLHEGRRLEYSALVVATGSTPRTLPGVETLRGVHTLRTLADATDIRAACTPGTRVVVIGGGFIGAETAWAARARGCSVTVVEMLPAMLLRGVGPLLGEAFTRRYAAAGIDLRMNTGVAGIEGRDRAEGVRLTDGSRLPADVVVLGLGTRPETSWLDSSGLDLRDGVVCDERLAARGAQDVFAVGDVVRWRNPRYGEDTRVEHYTNAVETAGVVAANLTGGDQRHDALPYVWSDQLDSRLQVFGRIRPQDDLHVVQGDLGGSFVAISGGDGVLQGAVGFGAVRQLMPYRRMLASGTSWDEARGMADGTPADAQAHPLVRPRP
ncbi:FAD-dependent oxidoreductase [Streptomyces sp. NPDC002588]|uniref:NAD(P)/FAD-dependent oxidoreductase n=1 Tax=Streptomyces sp. NPDC002588 TaxID=3154419 RepID=UPI0033304906